MNKRGQNLTHIFFYIFFVCLSVALVGATLFFLRLQTPQKTTQQITVQDKTRKNSIKTQEKKEDPPEIILKKMSLSIFVEKNIKDCQVTAQKSKLFPKQNKTECSLVTCKLTTKNNFIATITAPKGYIDHNTKQMFFPGIATGTIEKNGDPTSQWRLTKKDTLYDASKEQITAHHVKLERNRGISIEAPKSTIDLKNEIIILQDGVISHFEK